MSNQNAEVTCPNCKKKFPVELDHSWKAGEVKKEKKLFGTQTVIVYSKDATCPHCHLTGTCTLNAIMPKGVKVS